MSGFNAQTEKLLAFSVEQYRELYQHSQKLAQMLGKSEFSRIQEHASELQQLQSAASRQDELLLPLLKIDLPAWEGHTLYRMRMKFINSILELNELLLPKIRGIMAVTSAELDQLHGGRMALAGYAMPKADQRGLRGVG
ncbi:MAG: hypothetical protein L3J63_01230 [Geopsychrobacter sp.]|nr:hypothetical protein [Geopsychrobacter sp.]